MNYDTGKMEETDLGMSNFSGEIDEGFAEALQANPGKVFGQHSAWNFCGRVWFAEGKFHEEVWVRGTPRKTLSADTLRDLMNSACCEFGCE